MIFWEMCLFFRIWLVFNKSLEGFRSELSPVNKFDFVFLKRIQYFPEFTWDSDSSFSAGDPVFWVLNFRLKVQYSES